MMLIVETKDDWDETFFASYAEFKNHVHQNIITSFPETVADYARYFAPDSVFAKDFGWKAFRVKKDGAIVGQAVLCWRLDSFSKGNLGFIDWINDESVAHELIQSVIAFAREKGLKQIKSPVDMNFFIKYRIRTPGGEPPFYGEPVYPDYYHDLFKAAGLKVVGEWDTYRVDRINGTIDFFKKRKKLAKKNIGGHSMAKDPQLKTTIRCVRMGEWYKELRIIYDLFSGAYQSMPEYEPISFEQFKVVYDDFKYIIHPWLSYIVELQGKPVGFSINFVDPLSVLAPLKGKKLNALQKALVFAKLRLNNGTYMIAHVGKIPGPNGEEIKGMQLQVSKRIAFSIPWMRKVLVTFQNVDSPSRRIWNPEVQKPYAHYVLYGLEL